MKPAVPKNWRELSEAAAHEQDPEKLLELVEQLNKALEEQENQFKREASFQPVELTAPTFSSPAC